MSRHQEATVIESSPSTPKAAPRSRGPRLARLALSAFALMLLAVTAKADTTSTSPNWTRFGQYYYFLTSTSRPKLTMNFGSAPTSNTYYLSFPAADGNRHYISYTEYPGYPRLPDISNMILGSGAQWLGSAVTFYMTCSVPAEAYGTQRYYRMSNKPGDANDRCGLWYIAGN